MTVAEQVNYESSVRFRYGVIAFCAALLIVGSQLIQLSGVHASVNELTLDLVAANQRATLDVIGATLDMLGLAAVGVLLYWLHRVASARRPELKALVRWVASIGAGLSAVMAIAYTIIVADKAHQFVTTGNQGYPEANHLTSGGIVVLLPLLLELGTLMLAIGCIWTSLSAMRVGLVTRMVGYVGVLSGALFLFPIGGLVPIVQGYWLPPLAKRRPARLGVGHGRPVAADTDPAGQAGRSRNTRAAQRPGVRHRRARRGREGSAEGRSKGRARQAQTSQVVSDGRL